MCKTFEQESGSVLEEVEVLELRNSHRHSSGDLKVTPVSIGDVVIVHDTDKPQDFWRLGVVKDTFKGQDCRVRGAVFSTSRGGGRPMELQ